MGLGRGDAVRARVRVRAVYMQLGLGRCDAVRVWATVRARVRVRVRARVGAVDLGPGGDVVVQPRPRLGDIGRYREIYGDIWRCREI